MKYFPIILLAFALSNCLVVAQDLDSLLEATQEQPQDASPDEEMASGDPIPPVDPREVSKRQGYETDEIDVQKFDDKKWNDLVRDIDYSEDGGERKRKQRAADSIRGTAPQGVKGPTRNGSEGSRYSDDDTYEEPSSASVIMSPLLTFLVYGLAIALIVVILYLIIKNISFGSSKLSPPTPESASAPIEDIRELEVDKLLNDALAAGNRRLAIRIYFLGLLKRLDEEGLIAWKKDKTNRDYMNELSVKTRHFEEIRSLTVVYEEVWYGEHDIPVTTYDTIIALFNGTMQKLKVSTVA